MVCVMKPLNGFKKGMTIQVTVDWRVQEWVGGKEKRDCYRDPVGEGGG